MSEIMIMCPVKKRPILTGLTTNSVYSKALRHKYAYPLPRLRTPARLVEEESLGGKAAQRSAR